MPFDVTPYLGRPFDPYHWNCWILVATVLREQFGVDIAPSRPAWPHADDRAAVEEVIKTESRAFHWIAGREAFDGHSYLTQPGDIALLRIHREVCHVAIVHSRRVALHVMKATDTHVIDLASFEWRHRVNAVYRHPDLALG